MNPSAGSARPRIITALDLDDPARIDALLDRLDPALTRAKIGKQLFTLAGPGAVERVRARGFEVFLDLKFPRHPQQLWPVR